MRTRFCFAVLVFAVVAGGDVGFGQDSGFNLDVHANSHATAEKIGLPVYPGATLYKDQDHDKDKDDSSADLGLIFNSFHFDLQVVSYVTRDSPAQVLAFYRKPLSHYGELLECVHGKPVGERTKTSSGLSCSSEQGDHVEVNGSPDSSSDHELRAGTPQKFRIVGIDGSGGQGTRFGLVYLELPKDR